MLTEVYSKFLRDVLEETLDDETWLDFIKGLVPESVTTDEARMEAMFWAVEVLLERSLMVVKRIQCADGRVRQWPGSAMSVQEVMAVVRANVESSAAPMDWFWSAWFDLSDKGARLGWEARLIRQGRAGSVSSRDSRAGEPVSEFLGEGRVRGLLAKACPSVVGCVRILGSVECVDALFSELTVNAHPYMPGNRYLGQMFRLDDGTVVGRRGVSAHSSLISVDLRFPDRSYERCICPRRDLLTKEPLPYRPPVGFSQSDWSVLDRVLVQGLSDWVWLAEIDSILAAAGVGVDDVPDRVFALVHELLDGGLAMVGSVHAGLISVSIGYSSWELSSAEAVERMRTELLVFGYEAWMWSACFHLTEKGVAVAEKLIKDK